MKFQLLTTVLIASIASASVGINRNLPSSGSKSLYLGDDINNFGSSDEYGFDNYEKNRT
ncbi:hypothetical protein CONCODRAFT_13621 [Conidiobolus coronatus NRRL 28638]|uniref:Uncharacterized protein n=1 Tax=Conidiobolus coronatus (strain ATCC 28846 / CBS 209.66 / NRRL 28638) TaxID=796925 RepID=A0A137NQD6_CONC2|nr:hypothetical protein CONCODRAFT_13621 [Conidiobolus coronatus NRRL 28638]|eukprot:KXN64969.1 hypothetical protein CONCODRAFT_13621 [Conidiobolus coronatus NRRL 28638]